MIWDWLDMPFHRNIKQRLKQRSKKKFGTKQVITIIVLLTFCVPFVVALVQNVPGSWIYVKWTLICLPIITVFVLLGVYLYWLSTFTKYL